MCIFWGRPLRPLHQSTVTGDKAMMEYVDFVEPDFSDDVAELETGKQSAAAPAEAQKMIKENRKKTKKTTTTTMTRLHLRKVIKPTRKKRKSQLSLAVALWVGLKTTKRLPFLAPYFVFVL